MPQDDAPPDDALAATIQEQARSGAAAASSSDASQLPRGTTIGRYVVIDKVGEGGMGVVYSAYDHVLDRRVALKLVTSRGTHDGSSLLLAEARAMAQLSHPAIVPVHDVGEFRGQVFLAMAFVDGSTLRAWQSRSPRGWADVVAMYRLIGEGLAFAHDEGIVHRDFKPDNVLVDPDGRPHITDFGLAKIVLAAEPAMTTSSLQIHTITGRVAGTPGYMSNEQSRGAPTDARTDQYAYCASLFEALNGGLPATAPPRRADVPHRVVAAIERGLAEDPAKRWPSMRPLLAALAPRTPMRRSRLLVGALALALVTGFALLRRSPRATCELRQATSLWHAKRPQVEAALAARGKSSAELVDALDVWTVQWTDMAQQSCRSTADGLQSPQLLDLRTHCLEHALDVTSSLLDLASRGEPELVSHVATAAGKLPSLAPCSDTAGLLDLPALPANPVQQAEIMALDRQLAQVDALVIGESFRQASDMMRTLVAPITATDYPPLTFALYDATTAVEVAKQTDPDAAAAAAWATIAAMPGRADLRAAGVWIDLVWIVGAMQHAPTQAIELAKVAEALEAHVQDKHQMALLDQRFARVLDMAGKFDEAIARYERASTGFAAHDDLYDEAVVFGNEALAFGEHGDHAKQREYLERAIALTTKLPHAQLLLADQLSELSTVHTEEGHYADARAALQRALVAIGDGQDDPAMLAAIHGNLGNVAEHEGDHANAEQASDFATAEREYRTEVELARDKLPADTSDLEMAWYNLGNIQRKRHELAASLESLHHALDILQRAPPAAAESSDYTGPGVLVEELVSTQLALGHVADGLADSQACLTIAERDGVQPNTLGNIHYWQAAAIWASGDHERARAVMKTSATEYRAAHEPNRDVESWLATH